MKIFQDWQILKQGRRADFAIILGITLIFLVVIAMNARLMYQITSNQTEEIGRMQLAVIRSDFQGTLQTAEGTTARMAMEAERLIKSGATQEELKDFFYKRKREQKNLTGGVCFNVYIAGKDWSIIPDFDMPPEYHAQERLWYKGALENSDKIYISEPYIDAMSGIMCYTMSKALPDSSIVVALDFNFSEMQYLISRMDELGNRNSLIVTKTGMIIGYTDMNLIGQKIQNKLPEYEEILNRVKNSNHNDSFTAQMTDGEHTIFSGETNNGWYMILSVNNWAFYKESYIQIIFATLLSLIMMTVIIIFYLNAMKNGLMAENALRVKDEFLSRLSRELRDPLHKILNAASVETIHSETNPAEKAAEVRESSLKLSDMLDNLFSFSNIVSIDKKNSAEIQFQDKELSKISRYARVGIISVLILAMVFAFGICLTTTISWGDTKMNREIDAYEHQVSMWIERQKSILGMFANIISENPKIMDDYPSAVKFLDNLAKKYPEISVCYMANPYKEHSIIMNNGWESKDPNWHVDKRPWYIETEQSEDGFNVSSPYYDAQTGLYCVTLAQMVYGENGDFLGIFAIDFYIDKLTEVLGESYSKDGYAFLVDKNGMIINHPNSNYQLSMSHMTEISGTEYAKVYYGGSEVTTLTDYTGNYVACLAKKNKTSEFTVIVANNCWNIYGHIMLLGAVFIFLLAICVAIMSSLINRLLSWQNSVNQQLKIASDTATAANKAKSQFLAQMSHEIRTPINAVLGMNEMILRESKTPEILDYAGNIQNAGRTLLSLINSILDFSKIEDGKMEIVPVRYETGNLINDLVNMTVERAKKKGLEFKTEISSTLPRSLYGDDVRLRQIITNLLTNAVKYTHNGSVTLKMSGKEFDSDAFLLEVKVIDTGIGIRNEDINKLFLSFQRLDEEKNRNIEGTGLGISIVQKLLTMMGSRLEVSSEYGKGSEFSFALAQKIIDRTALGDFLAQKNKNHAKNSDKNYLTAAGAKVLAVDDNDMNLKVITGLLKRNLIVPDLAESGEQGIELAKKNFYHIIFLDNMMPGLSGVETLKKMRTEKILSEKTTVVMLTASAIAGMREVYLREGFDDYLSKPIEVSELEEILERHLPPEMVKFESEENKKVVPKEKVVVKEEIVKEAEEIVGDDEFSKKEQKIFAEACPDINLEVGLKYCMDSKSFMIQMLTTFADGKKADKIQEKFDVQDWKNYQILVHALKSTSLSIGAEKLSKEAKTLELAAKNNETDKILANHAGLMADYKKIREEIWEWLGNEQNISR